MKKSFKILLTMVMVVLLFSLTAVVSSAATTPSNQSMQVHHFDGAGLPITELRGLPENIYVYGVISEGGYTVLSGEIETEETYIGVIAYSTNGIDFEYVCETDIIAQTDLASHAEAGLYYWDTVTYKDGYYHFPAYYYLEDYDAYYDCEVITADFVTWGHCAAAIDSSYAGEYKGEYNGVHIAGTGYYASGDKAGFIYQISTDGGYWQEAETPAIITKNSKYNYDEITTDIAITSDGVIFSITGMMYEESYDKISMPLTEYYITKDFETFNKIDTSALGDSNGFISMDGTAGYDELVLTVSYLDEKPIFYRTYGDMTYDEDYEVTILNNVSEVYVLNEKTNKLVLDARFTNSAYAKFGFVTESQYYIWSYNLDETNTVYKKEGSSFTKSTSEEIQALDFQCYFGINSINANGTVDIAHIVGVESSYSLLLTNDNFRTVFKVELPFDYSEVLYLSKDGNLYLYGENYIYDGEDGYYEYSYYVVNAEDVYDYLSTQIPTPSDDYTGLYKYNGTWYYAKNGTVDFTFTGLHKHTNGIWYYVKDGILDWGFNGLWKHNGTWYYVQKGQINWKFSGLVQHTNGTWYYVQGAKLNWGYTGLVKHNTGSWFYVQKGQINFDYTGLVKHTNGIWYYIENGKLDWSHSGLWKHNGTWYYVQKGQINWKFTGLVKHTNGIWYYVKGAKLNWNYTGLVKHTDNKWYYVQKGQINFNYTGYVTHNGTRYKVVNGEKV